MAEDGAEESLVRPVSDENLLVGVQGTGSSQQFAVQLGDNVDQSGMTLIM